jgi:hypothetical protein
MPDSNSSLTSSTTASTSLPEASSFYVLLRSLAAHVVAPVSESTKKKETSSASEPTEKNGTHPILHTKLSLALRHPPQLTRIPKHVAQRYLRRTRKLLVPHFAIQNRPPPSIQAPDHRRLELTRCNDLDRHDRFQDDWFRLRIDLTEGGNGRDAEGELRRVHDVVRTILEDHSGTDDWVPRKRALLECFEPTLEDATRGRQLKASKSFPLRGRSIGTRQHTFSHAGM